MSTSVSELVEVSEAARVLGVTTRHVARLGELGELRYVGRGVIERGSLLEYLNQREFSRSRPWNAETAWAAVALLSDLKVDWLGSVQTSRLRGRLRQLAAKGDDGVHELIGRARARAVVQTYNSYGFLAQRLRKQVLVVGRSRLGLADGGKDRIDGYINRGDLDELVRKYAMRRDSRGTMLFRATDFDLSVVRRIAKQGNGALAALDAASSRDTREHGVGARALAGYLEEFGKAHGA